MGCISGIVKLIMFIFNFACLAVGIVLIAIGTVFYVSIDTYAEILKGNVLVVPALTIVVGVFVFLVSFLGCCGALKTNKCMLITYAIILIIMLVVQLAAGIYGLVLVKNDVNEFKHEILDSMKDTLIKEYPNNKPVQEVFNSLQVTMKCCGVYGKDEYLPIWENRYPGSCCDSITEQYCPAGKVPFEDACGNKFFSFIESIISTISIVAIAICGIELLGALFAIYLSRSK